MMIVIINMIMTMIIILGLYNLQSIATVHTNIYHLIATGCYRMIEKKIELITQARNQHIS